MAKEALMLIYENCEPIESLATVDLLRRAGINVTCLSLTGSVDVKLAHGIMVKADLVGEINKLFDAIILPGGSGWKHLQENAHAKELTQKHLEADKIVCAICAAPSVALGYWGLIDNKKATCYPGKEDVGFKNCQYVKERVVVDGNIITASGAGVSLEFGVAIAKQLGADWENVQKQILL